MRIIKINMLASFVTIRSLTGILAIATSILFFGCNKSPLDYRNKFTGNFAFEVHENSYTPGVQYDTTFLYEGSICYGSDKSTLLITYSSRDPLEFYIFEEGSLKYDGYFNPGYVSCGCAGLFHSLNSLSFSCNCGGLGGGVHIEVTGNRK